MYSPIKILIIQNKIPQYRVPVFKELNRIYDITVVYFQGDAPQSPGFDIIKYPGRIYKLNRFFLTPGLVKIAAGFDVLIIMFDISWINLMLLPFQVGAKTIFWGHGIGRSSGNKFATPIRKYLAQKCNALLFYTDNAKALFIDSTNSNREKCFTAINTLLISNAAISQEKKEYFLYLGRLQGRKQLDDLLIAYSMLPKDLQRISRVLIVGNGMDIKKKLSELTLELHICPYVQFLEGAYDESSIQMYFSKAYAYVSPRDVGLGVVHSFSYGTPVVTSRIANHGPEIDYCSDENSYLYDGSINTLTNVLQSILLNSEERNTKAQAAFNYYDNNLQFKYMIDGFVRSIKYSIV